MLHLFGFIWNNLWRYWNTFEASWILVIEVAMNLVPLLHRRVSLSQRCEVGVSGFCSLDLMRMLAEGLAKKLGAPKEACWMAHQTSSNLQASCLAGILITITKSDQEDPWHWGSNRLSELAIEEHFGLCRTQSNNAQLSARGFFQAAAKVTLRSGRMLDKAKADVSQCHRSEKPLTREELLASYSAHLFWTPFCSASTGPWLS